MSSFVSTPGALESHAALSYFQNLLKSETDCSDVHQTIVNGSKDFVLLDVRSAQAYRQSHLETAINLPHREINEDTLADFPAHTLFVVYCAGPHCNGADKAAEKLAQLKRPVKKMIGGISGWLEEGLSLIAE